MTIPPPDPAPPLSYPYGSHERALWSAIDALCANQRRLAAALRHAADPTVPRQFRGIVEHVDAAIKEVAAVEAMVAAAMERKPE